MAKRSTTFKQKYGYLDNLDKRINAENAESRDFHRREQQRDLYNMQQQAKRREALDQAARNDALDMIRSGRSFMKPVTQSDVNQAVKDMRASTNVLSNNYAADNALTKNRDAYQRKNNATASEGRQAAYNAAQNLANVSRVYGSMNDPAAKAFGMRSALSAADYYNKGNSIESKEYFEDILKEIPANSGKILDKINRSGGGNALYNTLIKNYGKSEEEAKRIADNWPLYSNALGQIEAIENKGKVDDWYSKMEEEYNSLSLADKDMLRKYYETSRSTEPQLANAYKLSLKNKGYNVNDLIEFYTRKQAREDNAKMQEDINNASGLSLVGHNLKATAATLAQWQDIPEQIYASKTGTPYDTSLASVTNYKNVVRGETAERIENKLGKPAAYAYNIGSSITDSAVAMTLGVATGTEWATLLTMGAGAASSSYTNAIDRGVSNNQAMKYAVATGVAEMLFEKVSLDNLIKMSKPELKTIIRTTAMNIGKQAFIEGSEEVFTSIADEIADRIINKSLSEYELNVSKYMNAGYSIEEAERMADRDFGKQLADDFIGGAISGGVFGGIATAYSHTNAKRIATHLNDARTNELVDIAANTPDAAVANEIATSKETSELTVEDKTKIIEDLSKSEDTNVLSALSNIAEESKQETKALKKSQIINDEVDENGTDISSISDVYVDKKGRISFQDKETEMWKPSSDIKFNNAESTIVANQAAMYAMEDQKKGKAYIENYDSSQIGSTDYNRLFTGIVNAAISGKTLSEAYNESQNLFMLSKKITDEQAANIYQYGKAVEAERIAIATSEQQIEIVNQIADKIGIKVVYDDDIKDANGFYSDADGTIHLSKRSINPLTTVFSHEFVHHLASTDTENYNRLKSVGVDYLKKADPDTYQKIVNRKSAIYAKEIAEWKKAGLNVSQKLDEEITAHMTEAVMQDIGSKSEKEMRAFTDSLAEENPSLLEKIKEFIHDLLNKVSNALKGYTATSMEAKELLKNKEQLELFEKCLIESMSGVKTDNVVETSEENNITSEMMEEWDSDFVDGTHVTKEGDSFTDNSAMMNIKSFEEGGRDKLQSWLENKSGLSKEEQQDILDRLDYAYNVAVEQTDNENLVDFASWSQADIMYRADGTPIMSVVVPNGDYPLNIDFSSICKKRKALDKVLNALVKDGRLNEYTLSQKDINTINRVIKEHGFEIACGLCFVDSKRYRQGAWAESFTTNKNKTGWNDLVASLVPKGSSINIDEFNFSGRNIENPTDNLLKNASSEDISFDYINNVLAKYNSGTEAFRFAKLIKEHPEMRSFVNKSELMSSAGLDGIKAQNEMLYDLVNSHQGSAKPKLSHSEKAYGNEILLDDRFTPEDAYKVGGVRVQSFSDYMANMFFDYQQMFSDLAAKSLPSHAYTKEEAFALLFGLNGTKINLSVVPKGADISKEESERFTKMTKAEKDKDPEFKRLKAMAGLDANGNYIIEDETFPFDRAKEISSMDGYDKNVGIIMVGVSDAHIDKLLADPQIHMVIPYHKSSINPIVARLRNIDFYTDYTNQQNTRYDSAKPKKVPEKFISFDFYEDLAKTKDPKKTASNYVTYCRENGYLPKFDKWADNENYYKLLIDFRVYDNAGNYAKQGPVTAKLPDNFADIVSESLGIAQETENKFSDDQKSLLDDVIKEIKNDNNENVMKSKKYSPVNPNSDEYYERSRILNAKEIGLTDAQERELWYDIHRDAGRKKLEKRDVGYVIKQPYYFIYKVSDLNNGNYTIIHYGDADIEAVVNYYEMFKENEYGTYSERSEIRADFREARSYTASDGSDFRKIKNGQNEGRSSRFHDGDGSGFGKTGSDNSSEGTGNIRNKSLKETDVYDYFTEDSIVNGSGILNEGFKYIEKNGFKVSPENVTYIANKILSQEKSKYNAKDFEQNLTALFNYIDSHRKMNTRDLMRITSDVAVPVIQESQDFKGSDDEMYSRAYDTALSIYQAYYDKIGQQRMVQKLKDASDKLKSHFRAKEKKAGERRENTKYRKMIYTKKSQIDRMIAHPTKDAKVPKELMESVVSVAELINTSRNKMDYVAKDAVEKMAAEYEKLKNDEEYNNFDYDPQLKGYIDRLADIFKEKRVQDLDTSELKFTNMVLGATIFQIRNANKLLTENRRKYLDETSKQGIVEVMSTKGFNDKNTLSRLSNWYQSNALNFERLMRRTFGYQKDSVGDYIAKIMRESEITSLNDIYEMEEIFAPVVGGNTKEGRKENRKNILDLTGKDANGKYDVSTWVNLPESEHKIPKALRLSMIMHMENLDNARHIAYGGFILPDTNELKRGNIKAAYDRGAQWIPAWVNEDDIAHAKAMIDSFDIYNPLTDRRETNKNNKFYKNYISLSNQYNGLSKREFTADYQKRIDALKKEKASAKDADQIKLLNNAISDLGREADEAFKERKTDLKLAAENAWDLYQEERKAAYEYLDDMIKFRATQYLENLKKELSDYEKAYLEKAKEFFWEFSGDKINDTSMKIFGYKKANVDKYFPIKVDSNTIATDSPSIKFDATLLGSGFLKERVGSKKPILLEDITSVITRHSNQISKFHGYALAVRDAKAILNYDRQGKSLRKQINVTWGSQNGVMEQIDKFIADIEAPRVSEGLFGEAFSKMRNMFAGATLTGNIGVMLKQAASYPTAAAEVGFEPLLKALNKSGKAGIKEIESRTPLLHHRESGYATQETGDLKNMKLSDDKFKWFTGMITWMDIRTVRKLEYAAMYWVDENTDYQKGSMEYWKAATDKFNDIVLRTQPNYTTLERPELLRNQNAMLRTLFMFKTQPLQNYGILYDAVGEYKAHKTQEAKKKLFNAVWSNVSAQILFSLMTVIANLFYHKPEKYVDKDKNIDPLLVLGQLLDGVLSSEAGMIMGGSELYSYVSSKVTGSKYYGFSDSLVEQINNITTGIDNFSKAAQNLGEAQTDEAKDKAVIKVLYNGRILATAVGSMFGIPVNNIYKPINSAVAYTQDIMNGKIFSGTGVLGYSTDNVESQKNRVEDAIESGDTKEYERLRQQMVDASEAEDPDKSTNDKIKNYLKELYSEEKINDERAYEYLEKIGLDEEAIFKTLNNWQYGSDSVYAALYDNIEKLFGSGSSDRKDLVDSCKEVLKYKEKEAIKKQIVSKYKKVYIESSQKSNMKSVLLSVFRAIGYTESEAKKIIDEWE